MNSRGTRAKFLLVICRLKSLDTCTSNLSVILMSSGALSCCADACVASARNNPADARTTRRCRLPFIGSPFCMYGPRSGGPALRGHVQYSLHALSMARGGTEERIIAAGGRGEPPHDHPPPVAPPCARQPPPGLPPKGGLLCFGRPFRPPPLPRCAH